MSRPGALALIAAIYGVAIAAAWVAIANYPGPQHPMVLVAVGDVVATVVVFGSSLVFKNCSVYDPYWSVAPMVIAPFLWLGFTGEGLEARQILVTAVVMAWGARLTYNWARGWTGLDHEDWRYVDLRKKTGPLFVVVNFLGIQMFPTVLVYLGCLALYPALVTGGRPLSALDAIAALVTIGAVLIEGTADNQLRAFVRRGHPPGTLLDEGLWSWSRHPNYFGEIAFWVGLALFGISAGGFEPYLLAGPVAMLVLFVLISIPMMEKRMRARRPGYPDYQRRVSMLIPLPPRRS